MRLLGIKHAISMQDQGGKNVVPHCRDIPYTVMIEHLLLEVLQFWEASVDCLCMATEVNANSKA